MIGMCSLCFCIVLCQRWCLEVNNNVSLHWSHLTMNFSPREGSFKKFPSSLLSFKIKIFFVSVLAYCIKRAAGIHLASPEHWVCLYKDRHRLVVLWILLIFTGGQFLGFWLFFSMLFFSATCISLVPETPPTALILDVPSGGSSPLLPQDPLPSADALTGVTLKAPQVGLPLSVLLVNQWFSKCGPNQQRPHPQGTC